MSNADFFSPVCGSAQRKGASFSADCCIDCLQRLTPAVVYTALQAEKEVHALFVFESQRVGLQTLTPVTDSLAELRTG